MPSKRYIGAFGVVAWATRSGSGLVNSGDTVNIERTRTQSFVKTGPKSRAKAAAVNKRQDIVVRFTNTGGQEVGRLETDSSAWIAPLIDQKICALEGTCVYAPESLRSNDTIYLQLRCYLLKDIFQDSAYFKPPEDNRETGLFEAKESQGERDLRHRQLALVKLFNEINLNPSKSNAYAKHSSRGDLIKAAEEAENSSSGDSTPPEGGEEAQEGKEVEQDQLDSLYKKAQTFDFNTPEHEPADTFAMSLRKYQKQALHWMISKENNTKQDHREMSMHPLWEEYEWPVKDADDKELPTVADQSKFYVNPYSGELSLDFPVQEQNCLGGILADEMGLGKTIEMLSLVHSNRSQIDKDARAGQTTDINDTLPRLPRRLSNAQVEPAPCTTLVVAPMSLIAQWQSEAEKASKQGTLKVLMYYGGERATNLKNMCCAANAVSAPNVIITSYGTVLSEYSTIAASSTPRGAGGGLFSLDYHRVILDEAHFVKNRQSKTAKACYALDARHRWVLTGTPIVNRLEDLFSLVHFLRVEPWSNFSFWKTFITTPFDNGEYVRALDVVQTVLEPLVLRRTKDMRTPDGEALVPLPPRTIEIEKVALSQDERDVYDLIFNRARRTFTSNVEAGTLMKSYTTIFAQILRLRQSCCHPLLVRNAAIVADEEEAALAAQADGGLADDLDLNHLLERFSSPSSSSNDSDATSFGAHALSEIQAGSSAECPACFEDPMPQQAVASGCWHSACANCFSSYLARCAERNEDPRCFTCRAALAPRSVFEVVRDDPLRAPPKPGAPNPTTLRRLGTRPASAKTAALMQRLGAMRAADPHRKAVVFSQFTSFLDVLGSALEKAAFPTMRLDGTMAQKARAVVLREFADPANPGVVLLVSLRAGGVGLNLTAASRVFVMDPWWSWAVESQAVDRVHRMGQTEAVEVVRFVCEGSIEEKMLRIQERKKMIAGSLGMMTEEEKKTQRIEDIRELLS